MGVEVRGCGGLPAMMGVLREGVCCQNRLVCDHATSSADVDLDDADAVWGRLTQEERRQFRALLKEEDVTALLPAYQPWCV